MKLQKILIAFLLLFTAVSYAQNSSNPWKISLGLTMPSISDDIVTRGSTISKNNLSAKETLFMGDDLPDIHILKDVGLSTCPADACPEVKEVVDYISAKKGGDGCVRDVIEQVLRLNGDWKVENNQKNI